MYRGPRPGCAPRVGIALSKDFPSRSPLQAKQEFLTASADNVVDAVRIYETNALGEHQQSNDKGRDVSSNSSSPLDSEA